jgi:hypothetical protein
MVESANGEGEAVDDDDDDGGNGSALWPSLPLLVDDDMMPEAFYAESGSKQLLTTGGSKYAVTVRDSSLVEVAEMARLTMMKRSSVWQQVLDRALMVVAFRFGFRWCALDVEWYSGTSRHFKGPEGFRIFRQLE